MSDQNLPDQPRPEAVVSELFIYPIKSCRGISVSSLLIGETGPVGDRQWQIVDADAQPVTQRTAPMLATVVVEQVGEGLRLSADGHGSVDVAPPGPAAVTVSPLVGKQVPVADAGDDVAGWLEALTGSPARLVAHTAETDRRLPGALDLWGQTLGFVDLSPVLVANQASADWLVERASEPFAMDRFRANIVVSGAAPWVEDTWAEFTVGSTTVSAPAPWPRCAVPQVDQVTGERHREPALVLRQHRWCTQADAMPEAMRPIFVGNALFALGCSIGPVGTEVKIGDPVVVTATQEPLIPAPV